jgi:hypothetical protein
MFWRKLWNKLSRKKAPPPPRHPRNDMAPDPETVEYWVATLTARLARLQGFHELDAPDTIVAAEHRLIGQAIERLGPGRALSVMREWRELQRLIDPEAAAKRRTTAGRRYAQPN